VHTHKIFTETAKERERGRERESKKERARVGKNLRDRTGRKRESEAFH